MSDLTVNVFMVGSKFRVAITKNSANAQDMFIVTENSSRSFNQSARTNIIGMPFIELSSPREYTKFPIYYSCLGRLFYMYIPESTINSMKIGVIYDMYIDVPISSNATDLTKVFNIKYSDGNYRKYSFAELYETIGNIDVPTGYKFLFQC